MNFSIKHLLSVLGVAACAWAFTGCDADAEETPVTKNSSSTATNSATFTSTNAAPGPVTLVTNVAGTNANQQVVVVKEVPPSTPAELKLSKATEEVVKLAQAGVGENVILLYVERSDQRFDLDAADIVYLNDIGVSSTVIAAMLNHDGASPELQKSLTNNVAVASAATNAAPPAAAQAPLVPPVQVSSNYVATAPYTQYAPAAAPDQNVQYAAPDQSQPQVIVQQQPVVVQQPVTVAAPATDYTYFYSSLSPYGSWIELPDYGWCWRPTISVSYSGWRPYCHGGRWLYSDAGWYWHSDYSWGWAPFHYGRWYCSPHFGWVWTPGYTWAPSWVTWRRGPDYCGWAPLPPHTHVRPGVGFTYWDHDVGFSFSFGLAREHYTFVPSRHFYNERVIDHVVPTERTASFYRNTTVVNNYVVGNNNTIINNGIGRDYVASHTSTEIRKISIRDEPRDAGRLVHPDRVVRRGNEAVVYRPNPPAPKVVEAHRAQEQRIVERAVEKSSPAPVMRTERSTESARTGSRPAPRTSLAARSELPKVTYGTPAPVRPEPQRAAPVTRSTFETRNARPVYTPPPNLAPSAGSAPIRGSGLVSSSAVPGGRSEANYTRPENRSVFTENRPAPGAQPQIIRPNQQSPWNVPSATVNRPAASPGLTPNPVRPETPVQNPRSPQFQNFGANRPVQPQQQPQQQPVQRQPQSQVPSRPPTIRPQSSAGSAPGYTRQFEAARSPDLARPNIASSTAGPSASRPQAINNSGFDRTPSPAASPNAVSRSESLNPRPASGIRGATFPNSAPIRSAPSAVLQPREITPVAPRTIQPSFSPRQSIQSASPVYRPAPAPAAPARGSVGVSSAPIGGGRFDSAPPVQAARPAVIQPPQNRGGSREARGRVEIGR